ncbi:MAG: hypothetical protein NT091_01165, partial [Candidatus Falkowbacteria bacterium]|nr:hypothetical protein [Candidatus Falkowbacteria bacterium]
DVKNVVKSNDNIEYYLLYDANEQGDLVDLAEKLNSELIINPEHSERFNELMDQNKDNLEQFADNLGQTKITEEYIMKASQEFKLRPE